MTDPSASIPVHLFGSSSSETSADSRTPVVAEEEDNLADSLKFDLPANVTHAQLEDALGACLGPAMVAADAASGATPELAVPPPVAAALAAARARVAPPPLPAPGSGPATSVLLRGDTPYRPGAAATGDPSERAALTDADIITFRSLFELIKVEEYFLDVPQAVASMLRIHLVQNLLTTLARLRLRIVETSSRKAQLHLWASAGLDKDTATMLQAEYRDQRQIQLAMRAQLSPEVTDFVMAATLEPFSKVERAEQQRVLQRARDTTNAWREAQSAPEKPESMQDRLQDSLTRSRAAASTAAATERGMHLVDRMVSPSTMLRAIEEEAAESQQTFLQTEAFRALREANAAARERTGQPLLRMAPLHHVNKPGIGLRTDVPPGHEGVVDIRTGKLTWVPLAPADAGGGGGGSARGAAAATRARRAASGGAEVACGAAESMAARMPETPAPATPSPRPSPRACPEMVPVFPPSVPPPE